MGMSLIRRWSSFKSQYNGSTRGAVGDAERCVGEEEGAEAVGYVFGGAWTDELRSTPPVNLP